MKKQNPVNVMVKVLISDISTGRSADLKHELLHSFKFINMQTHKDTNTNDSHLDSVLLHKYTSNRDNTVYRYHQEEWPCRDFP